MSKLGTLSVFLSANTNKFNNALTASQLRTKQFGKQMGMMSRSGASSMSKLKYVAMGLKTAFVGLAVVGLAAVTAAMVKGIKLYRVQIQAERKLAAALKASGYAANVSANEIKKYAAQMQKLTGIGDEVIINNSAIMATFHNIKGQTFYDAMTASMNIAANTGGDLKSSVLQIGKALNDPIKGLTALSRVGVSFTAQQKEQIKNFMKVGDLASAQNIILKELSKEFGGAAASQNDFWKQLSCTVGDLFEAVGSLGTALLNLSGSECKTLLEWVESLTQTINDKALLWAYYIKKTGIITISIFSTIWGIIKALGMAFVNGVKYIWEGIKFTGGNFILFFVNMGKFVGSQLMNIKDLFKEVGKNIWSFITGGDTDFSGVFDDFKANAKKAAKEFKNSEYYKFETKPVFDLKDMGKAAFSGVINGSKKLDKLDKNYAAEKAKRDKKKKDGDKKGGIKPKTPGKDGGGDGGNNSSTSTSSPSITKSFKRGTIAAAEYELKQRVNAEILKANKATAAHTKSIADSTKKIASQPKIVVEK